MKNTVACNLTLCSSVEIRLHTFHRNAFPSGSKNYVASFFLAASYFAYSSILKMDPVCSPELSDILQDVAVDLRRYFFKQFYLFEYSSFFKFIFKDI
jgi:hypothetical protein